MIKSLIVYLLSFLVLLLVSYFLHSFVLAGNEIKLRFDMLKPYMFFAIFSFGLCIVFKVLSSNKKIASQLGFIYLLSLVLKIGLFAVVFKNSILHFPDLTKTESLNLLVPMFVFLALELYFIARLLGAGGSKTIS